MVCVKLALAKSFLCRIPRPHLKRSQVPARERPRQEIPEHVQVYQGRRGRGTSSDSGVYSSGSVSSYYYHGHTHGHQVSSEIGRTSWRNMILKEEEELAGNINRMYQKNKNYKRQRNKVSSAPHKPEYK